MSKTTPPPVGPHKAQMSAEQLAQIRDSEAAAPKPAKTDEPDPALAKEGQTENLAKLKSDVGKARPQDSSNKESHYEKDKPRGMDLPDNFGKRINVNPQVAKELQARMQARANGAQEKSPPLSHEERAFLGQRLPERPTPEQIRTLLKDPAFRGPLNGSALHRALQMRAMQDPQAKPQNYLDSPEPREPALPKNELAQLFRLRNKFENKDEAKTLLRYEIAKARQEARQKVLALKYQNQASEHKEEVHLQEMQGAHSDALKDQLLHKLENSMAESVFEQVLQRVLAGAESVPELAGGFLARFASKTQEGWRSFFKNVLGSESSLVETTGDLEGLAQALFRGLYAQEDDGALYLVADLLFNQAQNQEQAEHKFSQIALKDQDLIETLKSLAPGDAINPELLKKLGEQFVYLQLAHVVASTVLSEEQKLAILKEYRQQVSSSAHDKLQKALTDERNRRDRHQEEMAAQKYIEFAGDQHDKKQRHPGEQRFFMYMLYGVLGITVIMILFLLLRQI